MPSAEIFNIFASVANQQQLRRVGGHLSKEDGARRFHESVRAKLRRLRLDC